MYFETKSLDRKYVVNYFSSFFGLNSSNSNDRNNNNYYALSSVLHFTLSPLPLKPVSAYILVKYKTDGYSIKAYPFAKTKPFELMKDPFQTQVVQLEYLADTNTFLKGNYYFEYYLIESSTNDTLKRDYNSRDMEKLSDDARVFSLNKFELKDSSDTDNDLFPASYNAVFNIGSSDNTDKKYLAKIMYSDYGLNSYIQLVQCVVNCNKDNEVLITGGNLLTKGYYDLKIDLYDFNSVTNLTEGNPIRSWQVLDNKNLQAIKLEKLAEDMP